MSILAQIIGLACLLFWGFWLCCKLRLPAGFAPWLTGATAEESHARVAEFERTFRDAVRDSVTARMAGAAPAEPVPTPVFDRESLRGMSPGEINAHWAEIQNTLKG